MGRSPAIPLIVGLVLLTWMTTTVGSVEGRVLCFGADGHVAWEASAIDGSCTSFPAANIPEPPVDPHVPGATSGGGHCGPCKDVPAWSGQNWQAAGTFSHPASSSASPAAHPIAALRLPLPRSAVSTPRESRPLPVLLPALRSVRSTVLLI